MTDTTFQLVLERRTEGIQYMPKRYLMAITCCWIITLSLSLLLATRLAHIVHTRGLALRSRLDVLNSSQSASASAGNLEGEDEGTGKSTTTQEKRRARRALLLYPTQALTGTAVWETRIMCALSILFITLLWTNNCLKRRKSMGGLIPRPTLDHRARCVECIRTLRYHSQPNC